MPVSQACRSAINRRSPGVSDAGAKGCCLANSGHVMGSISAAALSFIVQEPSGIMLRSSAMSLSARERRYRIISVSVRYLVNAGWVRNAEVLVAMSGPEKSAASAPAAENASRTAATWASVVASSHVTETWSSSTSQMLMPRSLAAAWIPRARPGTRASTVSKNASCTTSTSPASRPAASERAFPWTRLAMALNPSAPW